MILTIKKEILKIVGEIDDIQDLADFEKNPPDGLPMVTITLDSHDNMFETSAENQRAWVYSIKVFEEIGKNIDDNDAKEEAEQNVLKLVSQIIHKLDDHIVLNQASNIIEFCKPAIGTAGYVHFNIGWARFYEIILTVYQSQDILT